MNISALAKEYREARPFPHIVLDVARNFGADVLDVGRAVVAELDAIPDEKWQRLDHEGQVGKLWISDPKVLPPASRKFMLEASERNFLTFLEELTGIQGLIADPTYEGGGFHKVLPGGRLEIHSDFPLHPTTGLHRRLNVLAYFNDGWLPEWGGELELWDSEMKGCVKKIAPRNGTTVVFSTGPRTFHGHPHPIACPPGRARYALALYYYTTDRPAEEKEPFRWASWQKRPI